MARTGLSGKEYAVDLSQLPATHVRTHSKVLGVLLIMFSLLWGGIPGAALIHALLTGQFEPEMLFLGIFVAIGAAIFLTGLWIITFRKKIIFDESEITVDKKSIFGHKFWQEPLERYKGVLKRTEHHRSSGRRGGGASYTLYIIELCHDERTKRVRLFTSRSREGFRSRWKDYARRLELPAMEQEGGETITREVEDLDKSVRDMVAEGKLGIDFDPTEAPPEGFEVKREGNALCLGLSNRHKSTLGAALMLIVPVAFIYLGFFLTEGRGNMLGLIGVFIFLLLLGWLIWTTVARRTVLLYPEKIHIFYRTRWGDTKGKVYLSEAIEDVRVGSAAERHGRPALIIATGDNKEALCGGLSDEQLVWLRNCILAVIAGE